MTYINRSCIDPGFRGAALGILRPIQRFTKSRRLMNLIPGCCVRACALQLASRWERTGSLLDFAAWVGCEKTRIAANAVRMIFMLMFSTDTFATNRQGS